MSTLSKISPVLKYFFNFYTHTCTLKTLHWVRSVCVRKCDQYVFTAAIEMSQSTLQRALSGTTDATKMCLHLCSPSEERTDHKTCAVQTSKVEVTKRCNQNEERADHKTCAAQTRTCKPQNLCSPNEKRKPLNLCSPNEKRGNHKKLV